MIQANGYNNFQFHFMYNKHLIAADECRYFFLFRIRISESALILYSEMTVLPKSESCSKISNSAVRRLEINLPVLVHRPHRPSISSTSFSISLSGDVNIPIFVIDLNTVRDFLSK